MARYRVTWEIDIEAGTLEQAARQARRIQQDPESTAPVFGVRAYGQCPHCHRHQVHTMRCPVWKATGKSGVDYLHAIDTAAKS